MTKSTDLLAARRMKYISIQTQIASGTSQEDACSAFGITTRTFRRMKHDYQEETSALIAIANDEFVRLLTKISKARGEAITKLIERIQDDDIRTTDLVSISNHLAKTYEEISGIFNDTAPEADTDSAVLRDKNPLGDVSFVVTKTTTTTKELSPVIDVLPEPESEKE